jgi:hypothetical protein
MAKTHLALDDGCGPAYKELPTIIPQSSVYAQHIRNLPADSQEPRSQFLLDLAMAIRAGQAKSDIIILGADLNHDVRHRRIRAYFSDLQMHNAILDWHSHLSPPATCHKNDSRTPIDGIWCSIGINPVGAGFLQFEDATPSDHLSLWADFALSDIIGHHTAEFRPHVTGLRASDPRDVGCYNTRSFARLEEDEVLSSLTSLATIPPHEFTPTHITEYNRLAALNLQTRLRVRESIRHIYRGQQQWSPAWQKTLQTKQLWQTVVAYRRRRHQTGKSVSLTQIRRLMRATNIRNALMFDENESVARLKQAQAAHVTNIKHDRDLRDSYLQSQDEAKANANSTTVELERSKRHTTEKQRQQGRRLATLKQSRKELVVKLHSTTDGISTTWEEKDNLERVSVQENQQRFSQTAATPPMQQWILDLVGYAAEKPAANEILDGTFEIPPATDPYLVARLLNALRMPDSVRQAGTIPTTITIADHIRGWRQQKERTGSVRTDLRFSDHIAATFHKGMAEIDRLLRQIPYSVGFSPKAYYKVSDFAIIKKSGIFDVELMRTIQLMVASFNMNNKHTGRTVMQRVEKTPPYPTGSIRIPEGQVSYSGRAQQSADHGLVTSQAPPHGAMQ